MSSLIDDTILAQCKNTIKIISCDDAHKVSMVESVERIVDFDEVKTKYANGLGKSEEIAKSVDGLMYLDNLYFMVEFKNGNIQNEKSKIRDKIRDSLLIFNDIVDKNISFTRKNMEFILVYDSEKNPMQNEEKKNLSALNSRVRIGKYFAKKAKKEFVRWGFESFAGLYFKNVHTYDIDEFKDLLKQKGIACN